jgi:putative ABC transport system substrate-binding protein
MLDVRRREVIALLGGAAAAWPLAARAQSPKLLRVGYSGMLTREAPHYAAFEKRMAELGYQEGRNFTFEYIQAPSIEGYEAAYQELAARNVDILLAAGNEPALRAARVAAGTTPIVFIALDFDPVEKGYVTSLSRPGSNSTGLFVSQLELAAKRVEFLRKTFPNARRVGLLWDAVCRRVAWRAGVIYQKGVPRRGRGRWAGSKCYAACTAAHGGDMADASWHRSLGGCGLPWNDRRNIGEPLRSSPS